MSAAAAAPTANAGAVAPAKKGKKKLIIMLTVVVLLLIVIGGGAAILLKKKAAHDADDGAEVAAADEHHSNKPDLKHPPTFLPLDPFVVNLADKEADRYAQIGITFEVEDAKFAEAMKAFMPAIRNGILMILSRKSSRELLDSAGKEQLAAEILRESARTMGIEVEEPEPAPKAAATRGDAADTDADAGEDDVKPRARGRSKPRRNREPVEPNPIRHVHFSNFIVQ